MPLLHHINQALRAHTLFKLDVDYMVKDGEVVIVDEFTGRLMPGRRWSDGLHQAVEAKEKVKIERENQTLATVTFQNYFRKYKKLAGMTGTADTEAEEFAKIYNLDVVVIPPNRPLRRVENPDLVYRTEKEKWDAIVTEIVDEHKKGRPVLVGTVSIEKSEKLSTMLDRRGLKRGTTTGGGADKHVVLNAKYHAQEAEFVAQAGRKGSVTIATNMAGRGTDILLGGNAEFMARQQCLAEQIAERQPKGEERFVEDDQFAYFFHLDAFYRVPTAEYQRIFEHFKQQCDAEHDEVVALEGLHIVATERHEARRIDNQLRGRAGRQGDPGASRFYLSLEDDLMRIFGSDRISGLMQKLGMEEGVPIEHGMVTRAIERAQKQVEAQNFSVRKHLLEYDDVMNKQRESIYALRRELLDGQIHITEEDVVDTRGYLMTLAEELAESTVNTYAMADTDPEEWDLDALTAAAADIYGLDQADVESLDFAGLTADQMTDAVWKLALQRYEKKEGLLDDPAVLHKVERDIMLQIVDTQWKDHLYSLDHLKEGIGLRGYGQRDPLVEYKKESFELFQAMKERASTKRSSAICGGCGRSPKTPRRGRHPAGRAGRHRRGRPIILNNPAAEARRRPAARADAVQRAPSARRRRRQPAARRRRRRAPSRPCGATSRKSAATTRARAAAERNTRSAMARRRSPPFSDDA